nr:glycosyl transferase family protein [Sphingomonas bacterium]
MQALAGLEVAARELMLFAAVGLLVGGVDDLLLDLLFLIRRLLGLRGVRLTDAALPATPRCRVAIFVPTWRERHVIEPMLRTLLARVVGDYRVFVAVYQNDPDTAAAVRAVADARVRLVINPHAGPTTKADNLNQLWHAMLAADAREGVATRMVVLHDAEDVAHPDELRVFDALIDRFDVIQLPVQPLVRDGVALIAGTYADAFAESHGKTLVVRAALGAGLPLAGVGCAIATDALRAIAAARGGIAFDPGCLVEDYVAGLRLAELRFRAAFVRHHGARGLVAIGEFFPDTFGAAIRQKARWMAGIALAGWDRTGWSRPSHLLDHWMRWRDRRALLAVVVLTAAYLAALLYGVVLGLLAWTGRAPVTTISPPGGLLGGNMALLGWRMAVRVAFSWRAYGWRHAIGVPVRFVVGNAIDLAAAPLALKRYAQTWRGAPPVWDKTDHVFPDLPEAVAP